MFTAVLLAGCGHVPSSAERAVVEPRLGRVLSPDPVAATQPDPSNAPGVAVVFSLREVISLKLGLEAKHAFDLHKGRRIFDQLVADGCVRPEQVFVPAEAGDDLLRLAHEQRYIDSLADRRVVDRLMDCQIAVWQSRRDHVERIVGAYRTAVGGTVLASQLAIVHGLAIHLGGGFKHAMTDRAARADVLADVPIAMARLRQAGLAKRILVIDLGALQANGIAAFLVGQPDSYLFDVYEKDNYPPAKQPEPGGIPVAAPLSDGQYRSLLEKRLPAVLDQFKPDMVFYLAGADVAAGDPVGRMGLSLGAVLDRDLFVVQQVRSREIPLCLLLDGGWARDSWQVHYRTVRALMQRYGGVPFHLPVAGE